MVRIPGPQVIGYIMQATPQDKTSAFKGASPEDLKIMLPTPLPRLHHVYSADAGGDGQSQPSHAIALDEDQAAHALAPGPMSAAGAPAPAAPALPKAESKTPFAYHSWYSHPVQLHEAIGLPFASAYLVSLETNESVTC